MPRFFFNVLDGRDYDDPDGIELPDEAAAEQEAIRTAGEIIRDAHFWGETWSLQVLNEAGDGVLTLYFDARGRPLGSLGSRLH